MSIVVDLPEELENELSAEAALMGMPLSEYISRILASGRESASRPENGSRLVEFGRDEGLVGTRHDIEDSSTHARGVRREAERRVRA